MIYTNKTIKFNVAMTEVLKQANDEQYSKLRMWVVSEGNNQHGMPIPWDAIVNAESSAIGKPILCAYNPLSDKFMGHDPTEIPVGVVLSKNDVHEEEKDGKKWLVIDCYIWKLYFPEIMDVFKKQNGKSNVSMEIIVLDTKKDENDVENITSFVFKGITLIGVTPAINNSGATILKFSELVNKLDDVVKFAKYDGIDFNIPVEVKAYVKDKINTLNDDSIYSKRALNMANHIIKNDKTTPEKINEMVGFFKNHQDKDLNYNLYGADSMKQWCIDVKKYMDQKEDGVHAYSSNNDYGTGENIKIDLSKDSMSNIDWGSIDKTVLRNDILRAKNYKELVKACYLQIEDKWEEKPSKLLGYPVCQINNNTLIYNKNAIISARKYLNENKKESYYKQVNNKLNKIEIKLGLRRENNMNKEEMMAEFAKISASMKNAKGDGPKYSNPLKFDETDVYAVNYDNGNIESIPYSAKEDKFSVDFAKAKKAKVSLGNFSDGEEDDDFEAIKKNVKTPVKGKPETKEPEVKKTNEGDEKKVEDKKFSAIETKLEEMAKNFSAIEDINKKLQAANKELKDFKEATVKAETAKEIKFTEQEVSKYMPQDEIAKWTKSVDKYNSIDEWKNAIRAEAFKFSAKIIDETKDTRIALPFSKNEESDSEIIW